MVLGPPELGRGLVTKGPVPSWAQHLPVVKISDLDTAHLRSRVKRLHTAWLHRVPVVVVLEVDDEVLVEPETETREPYHLGASFQFVKERLAFFVFANNVDVRSGDPMWWWSHHAHNLGAELVVDGVGDVVVGGERFWVDAGPRGPLVEAGGLRLLHREEVDAGSLSPLRWGVPTMSLAPDQRAAVLHGVGPARVLAPAGAGKTRVLTARTQFLRDVCGLSPRLITAVAYNTKAAKEMGSRLGIGSNDLTQIKTIHALAYALLRRRGRAKVLNEHERRALLAECFNVPFVKNTDPFGPYIDALATVRLGLVSPQVVEKRQQDIPGFAAGFIKYRARMKELGVTDFDDQVYSAIELLLTNPVLRRGAQRRCRHLLVDEAQDLTPAFLLFLKLLAGPTAQVFAVGDDDQCIYSYMGANPNFLIDFDTHFFGSSNHMLTTNYRCYPSVVESVNLGLSHNRQRISKTVVAHKTNPGGVAIKYCASDEETGFVADTISRWVSTGMTPADIAVLARTNSQLLGLQLELDSRDIPVVHTVGSQLLSRAGVQALLAWYRCARNPVGPWEGSVVAECLARSKFVVSRKERFMLASRLSVTAEFLTRELKEGANIVSLLATLGSSGDLVQTLRHIQQHTGLNDALAKLDSSSPVGASAHLDDVEAVVLAASHIEDGDLEGWLSQHLHQKENPDGVRLSSVHRAKGLEFPAVVVVGLNNKMFPHQLASNLEEERRVFHVAITRASQQLVIVANKDNPSRFINEFWPAGISGDLPE